MTTAGEIRKIHLGNRGNGDHWAFVDGFPSKAITLGERAPVLRWLGTDQTQALRELTVIRAYNALAHAIDSGFITSELTYYENVVMAATLWAATLLPESLQIMGEDEVIRQHSHQPDSVVHDFIADPEEWRNSAKYGTEMVADFLDQRAPYSGAESEAIFLRAYLDMFLI